MKNINLCEILKGHEEETFYSPVFGITILKEISNDYLRIKSVDRVINLYKDGKYDIHGECMLFPSKDQRDWNKWDKENNLKVPKTWSELIKSNTTLEYKISVVNKQGQHVFVNAYPIEKSAVALLKIHQLIEVGYGGNVTEEEWNRYCYPKYFIEYNNESKIFKVFEFSYSRSHIAFHNKGQAEEFLKYPENVQLLKDYFMV